MADSSERLCAALSSHLNRPGRPVVPAGGELIWRWFVDLSAARSWGAAGPGAITLREIEAYRRLTGWPIEERHIRTLRAMDEVFCRHFQASESTKASASRPMTAGLFDAMFN